MLLCFSWAWTRNFPSQNQCFPVKLLTTRQAFSLFVDPRYIVTLKFLWKVYTFDIADSMNLNIIQRQFNSHNYFPFGVCTIFLVSSEAFNVGVVEKLRTSYLLHIILWKFITMILRDCTLIFSDCPQHVVHCQAVSSESEKHYSSYQKQSC